MSDALHRTPWAKAGTTMQLIKVFTPSINCTRVMKDVLKFFRAAILLLGHRLNDRFIDYQLSNPCRSSFTYQPFFTDLDAQGIEENNRIHRFQGPLLPCADLRHDFLGYRADYTHVAVSDTRTKHVAETQKKRYVNRTGLHRRPEKGAHQRALAFRWISHIGRDGRQRQTSRCLGHSGQPYIGPHGRPSAQKSTKRAPASYLEGLNSQRTSNGTPAP